MVNVSRNEVVNTKRDRWSVLPNFPIKDPFQVQDYELSAPLYLKWNNIEFTGAYRYAFPINGLPEENLKPFGYFTLELIYNFKW